MGQSWPAIEVVFSPTSACLLVCDQDYRKTTEQISTKPGCRMGLGLEKTPLSFCAYPDKETDPGISSSVPFNVVRLDIFSAFLLISQGVMYGANLGVLRWLGTVWRRYALYWEPFQVWVIFHFLCTVGRVTLCEGIQSIKGACDAGTIIDLEDTDYYNRCSTCDPPLSFISGLSVLCKSPFHRVCHWARNLLGK